MAVNSASSPAALRSSKSKTRAHLARTALGSILAVLMTLPAQADTTAPETGTEGLSKGEIKAQREFKLLDFNGDGQLSRSEVRLFPRLAAAFDSADTNHDNLISYEEVRAFTVIYRAERARLRAAQADTKPPADEK